MATRMSSKTTTRMSNREAAAAVSSARPKTPNRGSADEREVIKDWAKRYAAKYSGDISVQAVIGELLSFLATRPGRTSKRKGGLGRA